MDPYYSQSGSHSAVTVMDHATLTAKHN